MIASVSGEVLVAGPGSAVVEVGGVGLRLECTPGARAVLRVGERARLATSLVVREDSLTLYGFASDEERDLFELLQGASGVGPRLAQAALATLTPETIVTALATSDTGTLTKVPGIGRKGAQRLVLELKDKVTAPVTAGVPDSAVPAPRGGQPAAWRDQVSAALTGLGWTERDVAPVLDQLERDETAPSEELPDLIRRALAMIGTSA